MWVYLTEFNLVFCYGVASKVEDIETGTRRPLINGSHESRHLYFRSCDSYEERRIRIKLPLSSHSCYVSTM